MASILETINSRISVRSYSEEKIPAGVLDELKTFMAGITKGPFGSNVRFLFLDESGRVKSELKKLGTYGMITGDTFYIAGAVEQTGKAKEGFADVDYGYCLEQIVLKAMELGLGTCWLGGSLNRGIFAEKIGLRENEIMPAITPVGIPSDLKRKKVILIQNMMQVRKRKDFSSLFFDGNEGQPLAKETLGSWGTVLEAVRSGPSASNKQPWRIIKNGDRFDFYCEYDPVYNAVFKEFSIQKLDIGIAICHFEMTARELGLSGTWETKSPAPDGGKLMYVTSWNCGSK